MIEGHIETLGADGVVHGWLRESGQASPCHVQVVVRRQVVAEALALEFRPDLLRSGHGHGHYGFRARLRAALPPGRCGVELHLPRTGVSARLGMEVPRLALAGPARVEALLATAPGWTTQDVLAMPSCLDMPASHASLGTARFVDAVFRFAFDRWPSDAEARHHAGDLETGRIAPGGLLLELLGSRERADMEPALISPFHPDFPFPAA